jgi:hypothetical protein
MIPRMTVVADLTQCEGEATLTLRLDAVGNCHHNICLLYRKAFWHLWPAVWEESAAVAQWCCQGAALRATVQVRQRVCAAVSVGDRSCDTV